MQQSFQMTSDKNNHGTQRWLRPVGCVWGWGTRLLDSLLLSIYDVDALGGVCHAMALQVVNDF